MEIITNVDIDFELLRILFSGLLSYEIRDEQLEISRVTQSHIIRGLNYGLDDYLMIKRSNK